MPIDKASVIREAQKYTLRGQIEKAIAEWQKLLAEAHDGNVYNVIGDLYLKKNAKKDAVEAFLKAAEIFRSEGFYLKAMAIYKKILNINPADVDSLIALAELNAEKGLTGNANENYLIAAEISIKQGAIERALNIYQRMLKLSPLNVPLKTRIAELYRRIGLDHEALDVYLEIASNYMDSGDFNNSKTFLEKAIAINPRNPKILLGLSTIYQKTGDESKSLEYLEMAKDAAPEDIEILLNYSSICLETGKLDAAEDSLNKVIAVEPYNLRARRLLGRLYLQKGRKEDAWEHLIPVIDSLVEDGHPDEAIGILKDLESFNPAEAKRRLVTIYKSLNNYGEAEAILRELAKIYLDQGMLKESLYTYRELLEISPDDIDTREKIKDIEGTVGHEIGVKEAVEKPSEDALLEVDVFLRYGLFKDALKVLESLKQREPENIEVHMKLKNLYMEMGDKENAVDECLILADIYNRDGDIEKRDQAIEAAYNIDPEDPRLLGKTLFVSPGVRPIEAPSGAVSEEEIGAVDVDEEMAEADFYVQQGLTDEALKIYNKILSLHPGMENVRTKIEGLIPKEVHEAEKEKAAEETGKEEIRLEELIGMPVEAEEVSPYEPTIDKELEGIFDEFKKGLEKELKEEDYETHYNLGIAYKEMGLIDDAIREFQVSSKDPGRIIQNASMLGMCYMEKGLYPLAVNEFSRVIEQMSPSNEGYIEVKYDLAEAHEKNGNIKDALRLYMEVYGSNAKFREVSQKVDTLKRLVPEAEGSITEDKQKVKKDRVSYI